MIIDLCFPSKIFSFFGNFSWDDCKAQDKLEKCKILEEKLTI